MRDVVPSRTVYATTAQQGAVLLDVRGRGRWYALSSSGALWWSHLAAGDDAETAADRVAEHYGAPVEQVRADMRALARQLLARHLLREAGRGRRWWWT
ncbi:PqqD family protein [Streptomyces boncukensis]|uniref:PqqD family protein n=1 Tax=Streptomyces boncukensis TaxID=2711219 RepID=A0A6G4WY21_9ACTN|nr:PqqD family protein [Streptomyces boncukensis]NGO70008.1 PqqD family protein [Streptomyces boncukensis]